jgi:hypothetical protein
MTMNEDGHSPADGRRKPGTGKEGEMAEDTPSLDPKVQEQLGRVFRNYCEDLVHQPIPDKLAVLLARLEAKQRGKE